jgi:cell division transport system permease protein
MRLIFRETFMAFRRAPLLSALSVTTIAFSLFVFGLFGLVAVNLRATIGNVAERVEVVAYLKRGTAVEALSLAIADIEGIPQVERVTHVTEDEALARARRELKELRDIFQDLEANPLPASLEVRLKPQFRTADQASKVAEMLKALPIVDDVRFGRDWIEKLDRLRNIAGAVGLVIGGAFALVAAIIIGTTIRMTVLQRGREIAIMRLVGATDGFVRLPFLLEGLVKGLMGGALALALSWGTWQMVQSNLQAAFFTPTEAVLGVLAGGAIGLLGSALSVGRHLKSV